MRSIGLDLGTKIVGCVVHEDGRIERFSVHRAEDLRAVLGPERARVGFEASRGAWHVRDLLTQWGHDALMIDTTRAKQMGIGQHGRKNDRVDAEVIARAVAHGRVPLAHVLSPAGRELRRVVMVRRGLVETSATCVTTIRAMARDVGERIGKCEVDLFLEKVRASKLSEQTMRDIAPLLAVLESVQRQLCDVDARLAGLAEQKPVVAKLMSAPGVALVTATMFVSVIDRPERFKSARQVTSYLGLAPREDSSGLASNRLGSITKQGNSYLRALLVQSAWTVLRSRQTDDPLVRWGKDVADRRGKRIAAVAVARRLAAILWAMWRRDVAYDPAHVAMLSADGLEQNAEVIAAQAASMRRAATKSKRRSQKLARRTQRFAVQPSP